MLDTLRERLLPETQRRTSDELDDDLNLRSGDARAKQSAFWAMLVLSAIIASAGVITDSTATVIGAMIIAPLSTPIMGIALSIVLGRRNGSVVYVTLGTITVIIIGVVFSLAVPQNIALLSNSQIASRTSPGLADLVAAIATGFAGAIALSRRDVAAVLPGVAIAISLVPPLAVVGVCLGQGAPNLAAGACLLFFSNLLAMVAAGVITFATLNPLSERHARRRPGLVIASLAVVIAVPLAANTAAVYAIDRYSSDVRSTAERWLASTPDATVTSVDFNSPTDVQINIRHTGDLPSYSDLLDNLHGVIPDGIAVHVDAAVGSDTKIGEVGGN
ncbi:DUF389 domain-containing protein [Nocardioides sp. MAH-18]|uniref:DUF389 domain-containing protein n=1 Tax=Nocardioides agri TaxID=2682843 RepID=A0A6L6XWB6_9ACTN|nr:MULTISPECIES: DUF389 domain-containing protein [unclassified Nocardioides]MBA2956162.1 DUF389 domain-containing protein [Nocardioides sp. CGMCC 1.13656]MVQ51007.1 DUF389 domain-containing protein [Nocardioides sp. MAH-18]